jgi:hypothetical protein
MIRSMRGLTSPDSSLIVHAPWTVVTLCNEEPTEITPDVITNRHQTCASRRERTQLSAGRGAYRMTVAPFTRTRQGAPPAFVLLWSNGFFGAK